LVSNVLAPPLIAIECVAIEGITIDVVAFPPIAIDVVSLPQVAIKGVHWARDGPKFVCKVDGCDASYTFKYNLVWHLWACHNVTMELGKPKCPSIWE